MNALYYPYKPSTPLVITLYLLKRREINIEVLDERAGNIQKNPNQGNITGGERNALDKYPTNDIGIHGWCSMYTDNEKNITEIDNPICHICCMHFNYNFSVFMVLYASVESVSM